MTCKLLYKLYRVKSFRLKKIIRNLVSKLEKGEMYSETLRLIFKEYHDVEIGMYTHGGCFVPFQVDRHTSIGRYCSIARSMRIVNRNHPLEFKSMHAMFCIASFNLCKEDLVHHTPLRIGNDVWIGHNAIVMPNVEEIGDGYARFSMPLRREFMQANGVMQGGLIVAMADETIAHAIMSVLNPEDNIATIELKNNFLATVRKGTVTSEATVFKKGRTLIVGDSIVSDDNGKIITRTTATFLVCR